MLSTLQSKVNNDILYITLVNPKFKNSFGPDQAVELNQILNKYKTKKLKGLIFTAKQSTSFCSGGNLKFYSQLKTKKEGLCLL